MVHPSTSSGQVHHAYVAAGEREEALKTVEHFIEQELGQKIKVNPDISFRTYDLLTVEDVRAIIASAYQAPLAGSNKVIVTSATRIYHEAQNALLKLFEDPPAKTILFLVVPAIGVLLPTLRSRVAVLDTAQHKAPAHTKITEAFLQASPEKRSALIQKLTTGKDEEERRANRDEALALVNDLEAALYEGGITPQNLSALKDLSALRSYLYERSAPLKMILEHLALTLPKGVLK